VQKSKQPTVSVVVSIIAGVRATMSMATTSVGVA